MTARTSTNKPKPVERTRDDALASIIAYACTLPSQEKIANALGVNGKTVRGRSRAATHKHADGEATPSFRANVDGQKPPTRVVEAIVYTFAPQDDAALFALADKLAPQDA